MSLTEKSLHKQKKSLGNNMLMTSKYRTMVFSLFFLALKYAWKTKGQAAKDLKDSDLTAQTKKKHCHLQLEYRRGSVSMQKWSRKLSAMIVVSALFSHEI